MVEDLTVCLVDRMVLVLSCLPSAMRTEFMPIYVFTSSFGHLGLLLRSIFLFGDRFGSVP